MTDQSRIIRKRIYLDEFDMLVDDGIRL